MTKRDANAKNLADALDFSKQRKAIALPEFTKVDPKACDFSTKGRDGRDHDGRGELISRRRPVRWA